MRGMVPLCSQLIVPDEIDDLIHIVMAQLIAASLRHHAHQRLGPAWPHEDAPLIAELRLHFGDLRLQPFVRHRPVLVLDLDIDEQLLSFERRI